MTDTEANKALCAGLFERFSAGDIPGVLHLMDGRIAAVREYLDTLHVRAVWLAA